MRKIAFPSVMRPASFVVVLNLIKQLQITSARLEASSGLTFVACTWSGLGSRCSPVVISGLMYVLV